MSSPEGQSLPLETCRWRSRVCFGLTTPRTRTNFVWGAKKRKTQFEQPKGKGSQAWEKGTFRWYYLVQSWASFRKVINKDWRGGRGPEGGSLLRGAQNQRSPLPQVSLCWSRKLIREIRLDRTPPHTHRLTDFSTTS